MISRVCARAFIAVGNAIGHHLVSDTFVNYSRAPEAKFPVQDEQSYAAANWVVEHGNEHRIDGHNMAIAGDSVGGNMTAAVTLMAKRRGGPKFVYQVLFYPVTDANFERQRSPRPTRSCTLRSILRRNDRDQRSAGT